MEDQGQRPISSESKAKLILETSRSMQEVTHLIDQARFSIRKIDAAALVFPDSQKNMGNGFPDEQHHIRRLAEYTLVLGLIQLDISSAFRIYLKGDEPYDTIYASKQLLVTINEGYKQIYHYVNVIDGELVDDKRKQSYWVKDMGRLVSQEIPEMLDNYKSITVALDDYDDLQLKQMTKPRNLAIHYDKNASKVYDMLIALDIETLAKKAIPFIGILNNMVSFSMKCLRQYETLISQRTNNMEAFHINKLEGLKATHPNAEDLFSMMQQQIRDFLKL